MPYSMMSLPKPFIMQSSAGFQSAAILMSFFVPFVRNRKRIYSFIRHTDYPNLVPSVSTLEFNALRFIVPMCFDPSRIVSYGNRYGY